MRKYINVLAAVILVSICTVACALRKGEPVTQRAFTNNDERVMAGEVLYVQHCNKCHPAGDAGLGPSLNANPAPQFIKRFQVRHGLGVMPSFKRDEISKNELHKISAYMKAWKHY